MSASGSLQRKFVWGIAIIAIAVFAVGIALALMWLVRPSPSDQLRDICFGELVMAKREPRTSPGRMQRLRSMFLSDPQLWADTSWLDVLETGQVPVEPPAFVEFVALLAFLADHGDESAVRFMRRYKVEVRQVNSGAGPKQNLYQVVSRLGGRGGLEASWRDHPVSVEVVGGEVFITLIAQE